MPSKIKLLTVNDSSEWESYLDIFPNVDIYYHYNFLKNFTKNSNPEIHNSFCGQGYLLVFEDSSGLVINPIIKRRITEISYFNGIKEFKPYFDIISPYGYSGPLFLANDNMSNLIQSYFSDIPKFFKKENIISEFIRFNPFLSNHNPFEDSNDLKINSKVVVVDLHPDVDTLLSNMNKKTRNQIRRSNSKGVSVSIRNDEDSIIHFSKIYSETMKFNGASRKYDFDARFFINNFTNLRDKINLFIAELEGEIISGSLFINHNDSIHYYFSGTKPNYRNFIQTI